MEAALREVSQVDLGSLIDPPPVPVRNPPTPQTGRTAPPPPSRVVASPASAPPPPPHRAAPPPAPTKYSAHPPPAPPSSPPPPPPISAVPPPPPPPMNLPPPPPNFAPPPPDARSALLEGIRGGTTLKVIISTIQSSSFSLIISITYFWGGDSTSIYIIFFIAFSRWKLTIHFDWVFKRKFYLFELRDLY